jgi:hypothetical protein
MGKEKVRPTGALKAFLAADKNTRVIGQVDKYLLSRPPSKRSSLVIHPSEMASASWCHRAQYFWLKGEKPKHEPVGLRKALIFAHGHSIHSNWQNWFHEMGKLKGKWFCTVCKAEYFGLPSDHPGDCKYNVVYEEVPLFFDPLKIAGQADGWLVDFGDPLLLEIKSIGEGSIRWYAPEIAYAHSNFSEMWEAIKVPFLEHIQQAQVYMKLMELMGLVNAPKEALILYEAKGTHEVKEFVVSKSDFGVSELFDHAAQIIGALDGGVAPTCNINGADGCNKCSHYTEE